MKEAMSLNNAAALPNPLPSPPNGPPEEKPMLLSPFGPIMPPPLTSANFSYRVR
jgi:hypothetical protein